MPISRFTKFDVAQLQLDAAASLFMEGKFIPAITLAAAAEEILGKLLPPESQSAQEELMQLLADKLQVSPREARDVYLNAVRNSLKHHSSSAETHIETDPETDSLVWIARALTNYLMIESKLTPTLRQFLEHASPEELEHGI